MNKSVVRNYAIFVCITIFCSIALIYVLNKNFSALDSAEELLSQSHQVISDLEQLNSNIQGLVGAQRGYILTPDGEDGKAFISEYEELKADTGFTIKSLKSSLKDNAEATVKLTLIEEKIKEFTKLLESRIELIEKGQATKVLKDIEEVDDLKGEILSLSKDVFDGQYRLLNLRILDLERKQSNYFSSLVIGIITTAVLLILFNWFLLVVQKKRYSAELSLEDTKNRLKYAFEATQDGIFDWDIKSGKIFYSAQYFNLIGDKDGERTGDFNDLKKLLHPDDFEETLNKINMYLEGALSELDLTYRMKHKNGRWLWIQSRAKGIYNEDGKVIRLVGANTDISFQKEYEAQLLKKKDMAESANNAKTEFLAHMSHEIRTPLTAISGIAEILMKNKESFDGRQKKLIKTLSNSTSNLKNLVNDVLDFSRIESGEVEISPESFNLLEMMEEIISMMSVKAAEKNIQFKVNHKALNDDAFIGDRLRIQQILVNLIGNAIKFTEKGDVKVTITQKDKKDGAIVEFKISDTGIGIDEDKIDLIFERFKQEDGSVNRRYGGTGLGLPISKNLATLMSGTINVESKKDIGSTFTLALPMIVDTDEAQKTPSPKMIKKLNDKIKSSIKEESRVLIVEDYEANVIVLTYLLDELSIEFDVAQNGEIAINLFQERHYDAILMDVQMPVVDGFEATRTIRNLENENDLERTPIIGMTAHAFVSDRDQCIEVGMDSYLPKPIVEKDLKKELLSVLSIDSKDKKKKAI